MSNAAISNTAVYDLKTESSKHSTLYFAYILNIFSCIAVVLLHTSLLVFNVTYTDKWLHAEIIQAFCIFAVPIFFMISGANLLGYRKRYSTKTFFTKRFSKIGVALIGGSVICYLIFALFPQYFFAADQIAQSASIKDFIKRLLTNQINDVYWFLYSIIYLYMLTPILSRLIEYKKTLEYLLVALGFTSIVLPMLVHFGIQKQYFSHFFNWPLFTTSSLLYFLLGYYIRAYTRLSAISSKITALVSGCIYVCASIGMSVAGLVNNHYFDSTHVETGNIAYNSYWISTQSPLCVIQAVALFICLQSLEPALAQLPKRALSIIKLLSSATLGIYLYHILLVNWLQYDMYFPQILQGMVIKAIVIYILIGIIVLFGKQIITLVKSTLIKLTR